MASLIDRIRDQLRAWDRQAAVDTLRRFEVRHGLDLRARKAVVADVRAVKRALVPDGRPLVEHHWATWCAPCEEELPRIERLAEALDGRVDVIGVSWDRFQVPPDEARSTTRARVADVVARHGLSWPTLIVDGTPEAVFDAIFPIARTVPHTRVLDVDGGELRAVPRALTDADVDDLISLLGG